MQEISQRRSGGEVAQARVMPARANWGRWIVDCHTSWCTNAWMPQLGDSLWMCAVCGLLTEIAWPPDPISIEVLLLARPDPNTRNWEPGETLTDLMMQNAEHGILPDGADPDGPDTDLMLEIGGRIVGGLVFGPAEQWRELRGTDPSITAAGEPLAYGRLES